MLNEKKRRLNWGLRNGDIIGIIEKVEYSKGMKRKTGQIMVLQKHLEENASRRMELPVESKILSLAKEKV